MKKILIISAALFLLAACSQSPKFQVTGTIEGAEGEMLYLEAITLEGIVQMDSVRLASDGHFTFTASKTVENPEFYNLRIGQQRLPFSIDSTETLTFTSQWPDLVQTSTVSGSESAQDIHDISLAQQKLQEQIHALEFDEVILGENYDTIHTLITDYKEHMKRDYIFKHPERASAYFAVCQSITYRYSTFQLFDPVSQRDDVKCYASIATVWDGRWPDADRTVQLCNMAVKGMENTAPAQSRTIELPTEKITETGIIDVELPDVDGKQRRLSDLKGHVVLMDFTMYGAKESLARTRVMRELYNKYHERGLEIYQISLDDDIHFWKFSCENLPWVCVHETDGRATRSYAVNTLPTFFLINRDNEIVSRSENITNLEEELQKLL
ncbi:MAG: AhpC/TSA family protein [Bacteroidaceae bacterium]|nr:AhpC/TSA family protein [Bacteroidaceae bacterium]